MHLEIGDRFHPLVKLTSNDSRGFPITNYLPGHGYNVTQRNYADILRWMGAGKLGRGNPPGQGASVGMTTGKVTVRAKK